MDGRRSGGAAGSSGTRLHFGDDDWRERVTTDLNAATYATSHFLAVGNGGTLLTSIDGTAWSPQVSQTAANLYGVASNGAGTSVAVGASGRFW